MGLSTHVLDTMHGCPSAFSVKRLISVARSPCVA